VSNSRSSNAGAQSTQRRAEGSGSGTSSRRKPIALALATVMLLAVVMPPAHAARYTMKRDPASRHDFRHVFERDSKLWVHLHCELRVPLARRLPEPISTPETGDLMSTTYFGSQSMGSGDFVPRDWRERDGYRVWLARSIARESDLDDSSSYGVQLSFPAAGEGPRPREPMEIFALPRFATLVPYVWSPWARADELRGGDFAAWGKLHGAPDEPHGPVAAPPAPFEMRCRTVLWEHLYTPLEADDPNVGRPEPAPSAGRAAKAAA
jgi:hypothetical protein